MFSRRGLIPSAAISKNPKDTGSENRLRPALPGLK